MVRVRTMPLEEAKQTRRPRVPGKRKLRMARFDEYVAALRDAEPEQAVVFEELDEPGNQFVLSLRGAFKRAGLDVTVRKLRSRNEVRAWKNPPPEPVVRKRAPRPSRARLAPMPIESDQRRHELVGVS